MLTCGSQFNVVFIRTCHPTDATKDGFMHPAEDPQAANDIGVLYESFSVTIYGIFFVLPLYC